MLLTATALSPFALAEPLPNEQCEALAAERALLEGGGASENITRGPEWGKVNMTAEQLNYVRRLIAVREDLLFRCRDHDVIGKPALPSSAPADAPEPGRKPAVKSGARKAKDVPPPSRPSRLEAKAAEPGAESRPTRKSVPGTSGKAASRPAAKARDDALTLRGTLAAPTKPDVEGAPSSAPPPKAAAEPKGKAAPEN